MNLKQVMSEEKKRIDKAIEEQFSRIDLKLSPVGNQIIEDIKEFTLRGGKRLRAMLVIYGYRAFGGKRDDEILKAATAVELMQSFLLIHDDIMDCDELRRGKPTLHKIYEERYRDEKIGRDMSIIAGDICSSLGQGIIETTNFPDNVKLKAIKIFNDAVIKTCVGQAMDVLNTHKQENNEKEIRAIHKLKTATYTLEAPLTLGAALADTEKSEVEKLREFATPMGQAFQLQDDIIGMFGDAQRIGKPVGSDLREGKMTLLITQALKEANNEDKKFLEDALGDKGITEQDILRAKNIIEETGSLQHSKDLAKKYIENALQKLEELKIDNEAKQFFKEVAQYLMRRRY